MKKLSLEEKARRYDEAIEIARKYRKDCKRNTWVVECMENMFPELVESKDEKIRKWLIEIIEEVRKANPTNADHNGMCSEAKAWLEKQGEQETDEWKEGNIIRHGGILALVIKGRRAMKSNGEIFTVQYPNEWVKAAPNEIEYFLNELEKQGEQELVAKVTPKYKVGDWVVNNNGEPQFVQVIARSWPDAKIKRAEDNLESFINTATLDKQYHLWTISDARDGDVLATPDGNAFISRGCLDKFHPDKPVAYCGLDCEGCFSIPSGITWWTDDEIHPATKEERDFLFSKMHKAGYEWDAKKKELKEIEQKLVECRQENKPNGGIVCKDFNDGDGYYKVNLAYLSKSQVELIENLVASWQNQTNNTAKWSEEDENGLGDALWAIQKARTIAKDENDMGNLWYAERWLKSLKDRVQPQNTWKPTEDQISALEYHLNNTYKPSWQYAVTEQLLDDLKKLR